MKRISTVLAVGAVLSSLVPANSAGERHVRITAKTFEYSPSEITLRRGEPVELELVSLDRKHGFAIPELGLRSDVLPGKTVLVHLTPNEVGHFGFHCDLFCGSGHEGMAGTVIVEE